jgi:cell division protein FtsN
MVEIRKRNGRKPFTSKGSLSLVPKIVIGVLVVLFLGITLSTLSKTTTTPKDSSNSKPNPALGVDGQLKDSVGSLRIKPAQVYGISIPLPNPKPELFQDDDDREPDHDADPADENHDEEESPEESSKESLGESPEDKDSNSNSNDDPDEVAPELPDENQHEEPELE